MKVLKRSVSILLVLVLMLTAVPWSVMPVEATTYPSWYYSRVGQRLADFSSYGYSSSYNTSKAGQCVWYVRGRAYEKLGVNTGLNGNGKDWYANAVKKKLSTGQEVRSNSIACFNNGTFGHVIFVEWVDGNTVYYTEANNPADNVVSSDDGTLIKSTVDELKARLSSSYMGCIYLTDTPINSVSPTGSISYNGHQYDLIDAALSWDDARAYCEARGGYLAVINSEKENKIIEKLISDYATRNCYWLGIFYDTEKYTWKSVTGEALEYTNWSSGEPNNQENAELYVHAFGKQYTGGSGIVHDAATWNDASQEGASYAGDFYLLENFGFICEYERIKITSQPKTAYAKSGEIIKTTVEAIGDNLTYQWFMKRAGGKGYVKSSVTSATYSCTMSNASKDRLVYCVVRDEHGNAVQTKTVALRMVATITKQPTNVSAKSGFVAKTKVTAVGDGLTYTWYLKNPGTAKFSKSSVTGATYSCKMSEKNDGRQVYCVVKDKYGKTAKSSTVTLGLPVEITTQPKTTYTKQGAVAKTTVKADGDGLTYQWYVKNSGGTSYTKSSITSATYSVKMSSTSKDRYVYCIIKDKYGNSIKTNTVRLRMAATITTQPKSVMAAKGETAKVTLKAVGDGLTYTWYYKNAGAAKFTKTTAFTGNTYSVAMNTARDGRQIYCVVTDKYGKTAKTNTVTLYME